MQHSEAPAGWSERTPHVDVECPGGGGRGEALVAAAVVVCGTGDGEDVGRHSVTLYSWEDCISPPIKLWLHCLVVEHKGNLREGKRVNIVIILESVSPSFTISSIMWKVKLMIKTKNLKDPYLI